MLRSSFGLRQVEQPDMLRRKRKTNKETIKSEIGKRRGKNNEVTRNRTENKNTNIGERSL